MQLMEVLASRRSVRAYTSQPVEREAIEQLVRAATLAPSGINSQPWAFGVIEGAERLNALSDRVKTDLLAKLDAMPALERYREALCDPAYNVFFARAGAHRPLPRDRCPSTTAVVPVPWPRSA